MSAKVAPPVAEPTEPAELVIDWLPVMRWMISAVVVTPCWRSSSVRRMVTGTAVSASARRIAEPVTSTRSNWVVGAATAAAEVSSSALTAWACASDGAPKASRHRGTRRQRWIAVARR